MLSKTLAKLGNVLIGCRGATEGVHWVQSHHLCEKLPLLKVPCFLSIQSDGKTISNGDYVCSLYRPFDFVTMIISINQKKFTFTCLLAYLPIYLLTDSIAQILLENIPCYDLCKTD